jgi:hypothetical protein
MSAEFQSIFVALSKNCYLEIPNLIDKFSLMSYYPRMQIASALRRKREEIAATIAAYEARIDAARRDLTALDQAARLFDPQAGRDETAPWNRDRLTDLNENLEPPPEANEQQWALAAGPLIPLVTRTHGPEHQLTTKGAHASTGTGRDGIPEEFFYLDWP